MNILHKTFREGYNTNTNLEKIADTLIQNPKYKNLDFDDLVEELEPIVRLYDFKDILYSTNIDSLVDKESENYEMTEEYQNELTDEGLYADVTKLNKKYNLVSKELPELTGMGNTPLNWDEEYDFYDEDDCWKIYEKDDDINFIWTREEWEKLIKNGKVYDELFDLSRYIIDDKISKWGDGIDAWFNELNKKFDTDFYASNRVKESNHKRFSNRLKESNEYDEKYNNSIDEILTEAIIKCINLVCLLKDGYTENDRKVKNLINDINRDKRYLSDETNSFLPRTLYKDYISDILDAEIDNADNNDDEKKNEIIIIH